MSDLHAIKRLLSVETFLNTPKSEKNKTRKSQSLGPELSEPGFIEISHRNSYLKKHLNNVRNTLKQRIEYRTKIQDQYDSILKNQMDLDKFYSETRLENLIIESQIISNKIIEREITRNVYKKMIEREQKSSLYARSLITDIRQKLKKTDDLVISSRSIDEKFSANKSNEINDAAYYSEKLDQLRKNHAEILRKIEESKQKVIEKEQEVKFQKERKQAYLAKINEFQKRNCDYLDYKERLLRYFSEYKKQYAKLRRVFQGNNKDEILKNKEEYEIRKQTRRSQYILSIDKLNYLSKLNIELKNELENLKKNAENKAKIEKTEFIKLKINQVFNELYKEKSKYDEKSLILRKIFNMIKTNLLKFQNSDNLFSPLNNLIENPEINEFSKMLLYLENRINLLAFLVWQRYKYLHKIENNTPNIIYEIPNEKILQIIFTKKRFRSIKSKQNPNSDSKNLLSLETEKKQEIIGKKISSFVNNGDTERSANSKTDEKLKNETQNIEEQPKKPEIKTDDYDSKSISSMNSPKNNTEDDFSQLKYEEPASKLHSNAFYMFKDRHKKPISTSQSPAKPVISQENLIKDQILIATKFAESRKKQKLEQKRYKELKNMKSAPDLYKPRSKEKKRVTHLTVQIEKEMARRPKQTVELATQTFDALEKLTKSMAEGFKISKTKHDMLAAQKSLPNVVNAIINLRRARREEKVEKIAKRCHYIPIENEENNNNTVPLIKSYLDPYKETKKEGIFGLEKRICNLKSFRHMESMPFTHKSAFEAFYYADRPELVKRNVRLCRSHKEQHNAQYIKIRPPTSPRANNSHAKMKMPKWDDIKNWKFFSETTSPLSQNSLSVTKPASRESNTTGKEMRVRNIKTSEKVRKENNVRKCFSAALSPIGSPEIKIYDDEIY